MPEITPEQVGQQRQREADGEQDVNERTRSQAVILESCRAPIKVSVGYGMTPCSESHQG